MFEFHSIRHWIAYNIYKILNSKLNNIFLLLSIQYNKYPRFESKKMFCCIVMWEKIRKNKMNTEYILCNWSSLKLNSYLHKINNKFNNSWKNLHIFKIYEIFRLHWVWSLFLEFLSLVQNMHLCSKKKPIYALSNWTKFNI